MSLINKVLQDLDARGSSGALGSPVDVKPVARQERRVPMPLVLGLAAGAIAIAAAAAFGWRYLNQTPRARALAPRAATVVVQPAAQVVPASAVAAEPTPDEVARRAAQLEANAREAAQATEAQAAVRRDEPVQAAPKPTDHTPQPAAARPARMVGAGPAQPGAAAETTKQGGIAPSVRPDNGSRRGEDAYRRAMTSLESGRVSDAVVALEQALQADPRHDAARQTLVGLLVENGRVDQAIAQLQLGLAADPRQPSLAMLLARLQIERGGSGIETLAHTLPYVGDNGEYRAFLAGALQRQQRHREAAEQYQAALGTAPQNGVWWMGLGISLQAEKRDADARAAFERAQASAMLSPELQAFVQRKLQQLSR